MMARQVTRTARQLGIEALLDRRPAGLSSGERSRVALGRALVRKPGLFLLDEPLANLDPPRRLEMREQLRALRDQGATTICVTHDHAEALSLGDRIGVMFDGRLAQVGPARRVYAQPADRRVAAFLGGMNFLEGELVETEGRREFVDRSGVRFAVSRQAVAGRTGAIVLGVRFRAIRLADGADPTGLAAQVTRLEWQGDVVRATVRVGEREGGDELRAEFDARVAPREAGSVRVRIDLAEACWFDAVTGVNVSPSGTAANRQN
jgi:multiple sugar transport system ATP-binding protein